MSLCGGLKANENYNCLYPAVGGTEAVVYYFNRDEVTFVRDEVNPQIITDIVMKEITPAGVGGVPAAVLARGYRLEGYNTSVRPRFELVKGDYSNKYNHILDFIVFGKGSVTKENLEGLVNGKGVIVYENLQKNADVAFEILGLDVGLEVQTLTSDPNDASTEGAYVINLASPANTKEPHMPATLYDTSYTLTKAMLLAVIAPVV